MYKQLTQRGSRIKLNIERNLTKINV